MFLVTRPQPKAQQTVDALALEGFAAIAMPMIQVVSIPCHAPRQHYDIVLLTSTYTQEWITQHAATLITAKTQVICVGKSSADMLLRVVEGIHDDHLHIAHPENSEGMLAIALSICKANQRVALVKGLHGRNIIAPTLKENGLDVDIYNVYQRVGQSNPNFIKDIEHQLIKCIIVTSIDIVNEVLSTFDHEWLKQRSWMAASQRIYDYLVERGMQDVQLAKGASSEAIVSCAQKFY
jgi:uroporphyrinogen-III synthase